MPVGERAPTYQELHESREEEPQKFEAGNPAYQSNAQVGSRLRVEEGKAQYTWKYRNRGGLDAINIEKKPIKGWKGELNTRPIEKIIPPDPYNPNVDKRHNDTQIVRRRSDAQKFKYTSKFAVQGALRRNNWVIYVKTALAAINNARSIPQWGTIDNTLTKDLKYPQLISDDVLQAMYHAKESNNTNAADLPYPPQWYPFFHIPEVHMQLKEKIIPPTNPLSDSNVRFKLRDFIIGTMTKLGIAANNIPHFWDRYGDHSKDIRNIEASNRTESVPTNENTFQPQPDEDIIISIGNENDFGVQNDDDDYYGFQDAPDISSPPTMLQDNSEITIRRLIDTNNTLYGPSLNIEDLKKIPEYDYTLTDEIIDAYCTLQSYQHKLRVAQQITPHVFHDFKGSWVNSNILAPYYNQILYRDVPIMDEDMFCTILNTIEINPLDGVYTYPRTGHWKFWILNNIIEAREQNDFSKIEIFMKDPLDAKLSEGEREYKSRIFKNYLIGAYGFTMNNNEFRILQSNIKTLKDNVSCGPISCSFVKYIFDTRTPRQSSRTKTEILSIRKEMYDTLWAHTEDDLARHKVILENIQRSELNLRRGEITQLPTSSITPVQETKKRKLENKTKKPPLSSEEKLKRKEAAREKKLAKNLQDFENVFVPGKRGRR